MHEMGGWYHPYRSWSDGIAPGARRNPNLGLVMILGMKLRRLQLDFLPLAAMTWHDVAVIGGVMFLVLVWIALRLVITFRRHEVRDHVDTPTIDRRNREALESMLSLDEIAERAAGEPAPPDLIDAVERHPEDKAGRS